MPWALAISRMRSMAAARPLTCTGTTALVRGGDRVRERRRDRMSSVAGSTSTRTGVAPVSVTALAVAMKVTSGTTTSSPCRTPTRDQREEDRRRAARHRHGVPGAEGCRHAALELGRHVAVVEIVAVEHAKHHVALFTARFGLPPRNRSVVAVRHASFMSVEALLWRSSACARTAARLRAPIRRIGMPAYTDHGSNAKPGGHETERADDGPFRNVVVGHHDRVRSDRGAVLERHVAGDQVLLDRSGAVGHDRDESLTKSSLVHQIFTPDDRLQKSPSVN